MLHFSGGCLAPLCLVTLSIHIADMMARKEEAQYPYETTNVFVSFSATLVLLESVVSHFSVCSLGLVRA